MIMGKVRFVLKETLEELNVTGYRLAVESKIRPNSIYDILENEKKTISLEHLTAIINALNTLAKEEGIRVKFDIKDVLEYS
jgi:predicted transcriptional regulator